jgi:hypothetical protein
MLLQLSRQATSLTKMADLKSVVSGAGTKILRGLGAAEQSPGATKILQTLGKAEHVAEEAGHMPRPFTPLSETARLRMIEEPPLPEGILARAQARGRDLPGGMPAPLPGAVGRGASAEPSLRSSGVRVGLPPEQSVPMGTLIPDEEALAKTFVRPEAVGALTTIPPPAASTPPLRRPLKPLAAAGLLGLGALGGAGISSGQEKQAFVGPLVGAGIRGLSRLGMGAGKGLVKALKTPVGRGVIGTTALMGYMGAEGFRRGAGADQLVNPDSPFQEHSNAPSYAAPSVPLPRFS